MIKILVVGAGQIGSRHLQALTNLIEDACIYIREPNKAKLQVALERIEDAKQRSVYGMKEIEFRVIQSYAEMDKKIDVAIIASNSRQRMNILKEIVSEKIEIDHLILEKVLFSKLEDYHELPQLFSGNISNIYCNQWLSSSYPFKRVKAWLGHYNSIEMEVTGARWGLECNAVHFIDYFDFLLDRKLDLSILNQNIVHSTKSKRLGYIQLFGDIFISAEQKGTIKLESVDEDRLEGVIFIKITTDTRKQCSIEINFFDNSMELKKIIGNNFILEKFKLPYQSQLTNFFVNDLMTTGLCELPDYVSSRKHHLVTFEAFMEYFERIGFDLTEGLPIT